MRAAALVLVTLGASVSTLGCESVFARWVPPPEIEEPTLLGEGSGGDPDEDRLTLRVAGHAIREVRLDGGRLWGPHHEGGHFSDGGYRGQSPRGLLFLSEDEEGYVSGVIGAGKLTNVTYTEDPRSHRLVSTGRWADRAFGLEVGRDRIIVHHDLCTDVYRRRPNLAVFHGRPDCWQAGRLGADLHVPASFFERPAGEQVIFLSAFFG